MSFLIPPAIHAEVESLELVRIIATLPGETAQVGRFEETDRIDLLYEFEIESDTSESGRLTWNVHNRYEREVFAGERDLTCVPGRNTIRIEDAVPVDLGTGLQTYNVYASVSVDGLKRDTEFEIRIQSPQAYPGVMIEDVKLTPGDDDSGIAEELGNAAIPYTLEVDFRCENIISWARAEIRWYGETASGFVLDQGIGTTSVDEGYNEFTVDSYLARPPRGTTPEADFSVEVMVFGYFDTVTFPVSSLPVSLMELRSRYGVEDESAYSIGEGYLLTDDGARSSFFGRDETITARLLTGGVIPEDARLMMAMTGGPDDAYEEYMINLDPGVEEPYIDYDLPSDVDRTPGFYEFHWAVIVGDVFFAERRAQLTISGQSGINIPVVIDLPGGAEFIAPITWDVSVESEQGHYATMITQDGIICKIYGKTLDTPLNVNLLADLFESEPMVSGIPDNAVELTTEENELEGTWESVTRAYLGEDKVIVNNYWLYRIGDDEYQFLAITAFGDEDQVTEAYDASDQVRAGLSLPY